MLKVRSFLVLLLVTAAFAAPVLAQQTSTGVTGQVVDQNGNALEGATVEIVHGPTGTTRFTDTLGGGRYQASGLRVGGPYRITAYRDGFEPQVLEDIFLRLGESEVVDFEIIESSELDRLVVTGQVVSELFQSNNMGSGSTIGSERIDNFASISRSINDYIRLDPRATVVDKGRNEIFGRWRSQPHEQHPDRRRVGQRFLRPELRRPAGCTPAGGDRLDRGNFSPDQPV